MVGSRPIPAHICHSLPISDRESCIWIDWNKSGRKSSHCPSWIHASHGIPPKHLGYVDKGLLGKPHLHFLCGIRLGVPIPSGWEVPLLLPGFVQGFYFSSDRSLELHAVSEVCNPFGIHFQLHVQPQILHEVHVFGIQESKVEADVLDMCIATKMVASRRATGRRDCGIHAVAAKSALNHKVVSSTGMFVGPVGRCQSCHAVRVFAEGSPSADSCSASNEIWDSLDKPLRRLVPRTPSLGSGVRISRANA